MTAIAIDVTVSLVAVTDEKNKVKEVFIC
jgi:hypothetical protein